MREIKFRVWDVRNMRMIYLDDYKRWGFIDHKKELDTGSTLAQGGDMLLLTTNPDYYIWLQYSDLTDKNNKEIYEGDIIMFRHMLCKTYFLEGAFWIDGGLLTNINWKECEVVGNIYENPDLLSKGRE